MPLEDAGAGVPDIVDSVMIVCVEPPTATTEVMVDIKPELLLRRDDEVELEEEEKLLPVDDPSLGVDEGVEDASTVCVKVDIGAGSTLGELLEPVVVPVVTPASSSGTLRERER